MGWTDGTFIPIANEENKSLMEAMQKLLNLKEDKSEANQELEQRYANLQNHIINAEQDIQQNLVKILVLCVSGHPIIILKFLFQKLLDAHRSQLTDEHHMYKVAEYEDGTVYKKLKELKNNISDLNKYDETTKGTINRSEKELTIIRFIFIDEIQKIHTSMEKLSHKIQWSKLALEEWHAAMARGDETNKLIAKYCKEDEKNANVSTRLR